MPKMRVHYWSWPLRDPVIVCALALIILGLGLIVLGLISSSVSALQGVGGIVFGTGLTVLLSQLTNRQQMAKDANLWRKTNLYEPLHAELQTLRERLEETRTGAKPYLQWIDIPGMQFPIQQLAEEPPQFQRWSEFKADSRSSLNFPERMNLMLNQVLQLASNYNRAVNDALTASETILVPAIDSAITHSYERGVPPMGHRSPRRTFFEFSILVSSRLVGSYSTSTGDARKRSGMGSYMAEQWANGSLSTANARMAAGNGSKTNSKQHLCCLSNSGRELSPSSARVVAAIIDEVWPALQGQSAYNAAWRLNEELFDQVSQAETKLLNKLRDIQNIYEGGPPTL